MSRFRMMEMASAAFGRVAAARRRRRTWQVVDSLPDYVRKDIGWPIDPERKPPFWTFPPYR